VKALLAGRKTETRRILNPQPETFQNDSGQTCDIYPFKVDGQMRSRIAMGFDGSGVITTQECRTEVGDLIWVKEAHYAFGWWKTTDELTKKTQKPKRKFVRYPERPVLFEAPADVMTGQPEQQSGWYKRSSLFLPKLESRLTLQVTTYDIERLHQIDHCGAIAEGVKMESADPPFYYVPEVQPFNLTAVGVDEPGDTDHSIRSYAKLWDHINGMGAWQTNPWVDVTKFDVLHQNPEQIATR
jgi:hypothetical protein